MDDKNPAADWDPIHSGDAQKLSDFAGQLVLASTDPAADKHVKDSRLLFLLSAVAAAGCRAMGMDRAEYDMIVEAAWGRASKTECRHR